MDVLIGLLYGSWLATGLSAAGYHLMWARREGHAIRKRQLIGLGLLSLLGPLYYVGVLRWMMAEVWKKSGHE